MTGARHQGGFTLVELLVAVTLLAMLVPLVFSGFRFGARAWERGAAIERRGELAPVRAFLRRVIESAEPRFLAEGTAAARIDFAGTANGLEFVGSAPVAVGGIGRGWFTLSRGSTGVMMHWRPEFGAAESSSADSELVAGIAGFEIAYFGALDARALAEWHDRWGGMPRVPQLVRIRIAFPARDRRNWPDLVVRPMVGVDAGCVFDIESRSCRGRPL